MSRVPITDQFYLDLVHVFFDLKAQIIAAGLAYDLAGMQTLTLLRLSELVPQPMKDLCGILHCDASNVSGIIHGLEQKGLVERQNDPKDRRVKTIRVLPAGKHVQQQILKQLSYDTKMLLSPLTDEQTQQLAAIVQAMTTAKNS